MGGDSHPDTLRTKHNLALALKGQGILKLLAEAGTLEREVLSLREKSLGQNHPDTLRTKANLAGTLESKGDINAAEMVLREVLQAQELAFGHGHAETEATRWDLGELLQASAPKRCRPQCAVQ